jgi:poly(3-hydroxybutyrate) depolymerase
VPLLSFHGELDTDTLFWGRNETIRPGLERLPVVPTWRREWAARNGCNATEVHEPVVEEGVNGTRVERWACGVTAVTDPRLGHAWPSTNGWDHAGRPNEYAGYNYTEQYLTGFFGEHVLPRRFFNSSFWDL